MNVIFDPCRNQPANCCNDTYGTPEYRYVETDPRRVDFGAEYLFKQDGTDMPQESRYVCPSLLISLGLTGY